MDRDKSVTFAQFLLERKAISPEDLLRCLDYRRWLTPFLGTLAVNTSVMTTEQVLEVVERCELERRHFGEVAVRMGYLNQEQVESLLTQQEGKRQSLSECLMKLGLLTRAQIETYRTGYLEAQRTAASARVPL